MSEKTIAIRVDEDFHKKIKVKLAEENLTLKEYIVSLVEKDLNKSKSIEQKIVLENNTINENSIKEAQKVIDFVSNMIRIQNSKDN